MSSSQRITLHCLGLLTIGAYCDAAPDEQRQVLRIEPEFDLMETVRPWYDTEDDRRRPRRVRPLRDVAQRGASPPRRLREGFEPFVSLNAEYRDNLFFTPRQSESEFINSLTVGGSYARTERKSGLSVEYAAEAASYHNFSELSRALDAQSADFAAFWRPTRVLQLNLTNSFRDTHDVTEQPVVIATPGVTRTKTNDLALSALVRISANRQADIAYRNRYLSSSDRGGSDAKVHEISAEVAQLMSPTDRVGLKYRARKMFFDWDESRVGASNTLRDDYSDQRLALNYQHRFDRNNVVEANLGYLHFHQSNDVSPWAGSLKLRSTPLNRNLFLEMGLERDVAAAPGIIQPLLDNTLFLNLDYLHSPGMQFGTQLGYTEFTFLPLAEVDVDAIEAIGYFSFAVQRETWVKLSYRHRRQKAPNSDVTANTYTIALSLAF